MGFNQKNTYIFQDNVNINEKLIASETIENLVYFYPNQHLITYEMRWCKAFRDRGLRNGIAQ